MLEKPYDRRSSSSTIATFSLQGHAIAIGDRSTSSQEEASPAVVDVPVYGRNRKTKKLSPVA